MPIKHQDNLKIPHPFPGEKPFKPEWDKKKQLVEMPQLMNNDYLRLWTEQHDEFMVKRKEKYLSKPSKSQFPIYRKVIKIAEPKPIAYVTSKKYANVKSKVFNFIEQIKSVKSQWNSFTYFNKKIEKQ